MCKTPKEGKRILFIRADGSKKIGMAHLARCADLARFIKRKYENVYFLIKQEKDATDYLNKQGFKVISSSKEDEFTNLAKDKLDTKSFFVDTIIDILNVSQKTIDSFKSVSDRVICFTDKTGVIKLKADIVFAFSPSQKQEYYREIKKSKYYVGPQYTPLNPAFFQKSGRKEGTVSGRIRNILVSMGGSDATNLTVKVIMALSRIKEGFKLTVIQGKAFGIDNEKLLKKYYGEKVIIKRNVSNMREEMLRTDIGICSAGRTLLEFMCLGIPVVSVPQTKLEAEILRNYGEVAVKVDNFGEKVKVNEIQNAAEKILSDTNLRKKISRIGSATIDGKGISRIAKIIAF